MSIVENLKLTNQKQEKKLSEKVPVFDSMLESVVQMSHLDRFDESSEVLEAEVVEAFSALLRH